MKFLPIHFIYIYNYNVQTKKLKGTTTIAILFKLVHQLRVHSISILARENVKRGGTAPHESRKERLPVKSPY